MSQMYSKCCTFKCVGIWTTSNKVSVCSDLKGYVRLKTLYLYPRWNWSIWDAQKESKSIKPSGPVLVLMLHRLIVCVQSVPVLLGLFLSCWLWFVCIVEDGFFCKEGFGLNITSKGMRLPLFPPPVASLQRGKLLSLCACCVTVGLLLFCTFLEGFYSSPRPVFVVGCLFVSLSTSERCRYSDVEQQDHSRTAAACEMALQEMFLMQKWLYVIIKYTPPCAD